MEEVWISKIWKAVSQKGPAQPIEVQAYAHLVFS